MQFTVRNSAAEAPKVEGAFSCESYQKKIFGCAAQTPALLWGFASRQRLNRLAGFYFVL
jgi:hypothetical protein